MMEQWFRISSRVLYEMLLLVIPDSGAVFMCFMLCVTVVGKCVISISLWKSQFHDK